MVEYECSIFQKKTADYIVEQFEKKDRFLLADEVGLGKTIVAREVIKQMRDKNNGKLVVLYVCSSNLLAIHNQTKLAEKIDFSNNEDSRLSMLFLQQPKDFRIVPISPATSLDVKGAGKRDERILIYCALKNFVKDEKKFKRLMKNKIKWDRDKENKYDEKINESLKKKIRKFIKDKKAFKNLKKYLRGDDNGMEVNKLMLIRDLRKMFVQFTLESFHVDLVLMDEFQNFRQLLTPPSPKDEQNKDDVQNDLYEYFLKEKNKKPSKILLMSATPYRLYMTKTEEENDRGSHYEDFIELFDFLSKNQNGSFKEFWQSYLSKMQSVNPSNITIVLKEKKKAESLLGGVCARTERISKSLLEKNPPIPLELCESDIISYAEAQCLCNRLNLGRFRVEYAKSSPYLLSFMNDYKIKHRIADVLKKSKNKYSDIKYDHLLLKKIDDTEKLSINGINSKLTLLLKELFQNEKGKNNNLERLLWIPPSKFYYIPDKKSAFSMNAGASKLLVFSEWQLVPKMISALVSYYTESLSKKGKYFRKTHPKIEKESENLFTYCSPKLAKYFNIKSVKKLSDVKKQIRSKISKKVDKYCLKNTPGTLNPKTALSLIKSIETDIGEPFNFNRSQAIDLITDYIIGSPVECAYRLFKRVYDGRCEISDSDYEEAAKNLAKQFVPLFNRYDSSLCVNAECSKGSYIRKVLKYCVQGNMQAMLDEYFYTSNIAIEEFIKKIKNDLLAIIPVYADTFESLTEKKEERKKDQQNNTKIMFRTHFAVGNYKDSIDNNNSESMTKKIAAFNSPFRPFVFATTNIGEEGIDFHKYCRKVMHWNLPDRPIEIEQREGRVNRYQGLAIRQNLADFYGNKLDSNSDIWKNIFSKAEKRYGNDKSGMSPHWIIPDKDKKKIKYKIKSITPIYPFSKDAKKYDSFMLAIEHYRLALGQPKQEEFLERLLNRHLKKSDLKKLEMNLSPYFSKEKNNS